ncbi:DUF2637 domain-containing protein [Actinomadura chokoriensis]|uniref:DUF2637 domain-containing protein n=1 Tax=Actinomadura chokoriensis TaxID=454156 RepID=A0ABV4R6X0_9ACTN
MPSDRTRPSYTRVQRRLLTALAGLVVAALAGAAYVLTYDVLRELALAGRVSRRWAPLYPAMADTLVAMTILSLVVTRGARWWTRLLRWALLLVLVAGGAAASVQHSVRGYATLPDDAVRAGVAAAPHVMLLIAIWLWLTMFKQIRVARPAAEADAPPETQRGHVKVLEPAAPPLALEGPAEPHVPFAPEEGEELIPFLPDPATEQEPSGHEPHAGQVSAPEPVPQQAVEYAPNESAPVEDERADSEPTMFEGRGFEGRGLGGRGFEGRGFEGAGYGGSLSSEPAPPPLDALPEPRQPLDPAPVLLPTDIELIRSRDREDVEQHAVASTTRPDIVLPASTGEDDDLHDTPPADRPEDPDAGDDRDGDWNPPPSGNFRSGPTPPAD